MASHGLAGTRAYAAPGEPVLSPFSSSEAPTLHNTEVTLKPNMAPTNSQLGAGARCLAALLSPELSKGHNSQQPLAPSTFPGAPASPCSRGCVPGPVDGKARFLPPDGMAALGPQPGDVTPWSPQQNSPPPLSVTPP